MAKLHPCEGGCWFCKQDDESEILDFDNEFDTFVHISCIKKALQENPDDPEANIMKYLVRQW